MFAVVDKRDKPGCAGFTSKNQNLLKSFILHQKSEGSKVETLSLGTERFMSIISHVRLEKNQQCTGCETHCFAHPMPNKRTKY